MVIRKRLDITGSALVLVTVTVLEWIPVCDSPQSTADAEQAWADHLTQQIMKFVATGDFFELGVGVRSPGRPFVAAAF